MEILKKWVFFMSYKLLSCVVKIYKNNFLGTPREILIKKTSYMGILPEILTLTNKSQKEILEEPIININPEEEKEVNKFKIKISCFLFIFRWVQLKLQFTGFT